MSHQQTKLTLPSQGFGAMGLTGSYGVAEREESLAALRHAIEQGAGLIDTANVYGDGTNEQLVGEVLATHGKDTLIATKFGILSDAKPGEPRAQGNPSYVKSSIQGSLKRLGVDYVDLYYYHRVDPRVPIEETVGAMAELVEAGLIGHIGLSEVTAQELHRAHAVHPIAAVQSEWSVLSRDVEEYVIPTAVELDVNFVAYSPLGRGLLTGGITSIKDLGQDDARHNFPRFDSETLDANQNILHRVQSLAQSLEITPAQLALAWLYQRAEELGVRVTPIPGTRRIEHITQNLAARSIQLTDEIVAELNSVADQITGDRSADLKFISQGREATEHSEE